MFRWSVSATEESDGNLLFVFFVKQNTASAKSAAVAVEAHLFAGGYVCKLEVLADDILEVLKSQVLSRTPYKFRGFVEDVD